MEFEANREGEVLRRLFLKQRLLAAGDERHAEIRPVLIILSGTMRGAYGSGQIIALEEFGLADSFESVTGVSTGACTGGYLLGRQSLTGATIYCGECTTREFISYFPQPRVGLEYIANVMRHGPKRINQDRVRASRPDFYVAVTCARRGDGRLLDAKATSPDIVHAIRASIAIPGLGGDPVRVGDDLYTDGAGACVFPVRAVIEQFQPTDILVFANAPPSLRDSWARQVVYRHITRAYPAAVQEAFCSIPERFKDELEHLRTSFSGNYGIIWSDGKTGSFEQNPTKLRATVARARKHLQGLLADASSSI